MPSQLLVNEIYGPVSQGEGPSIGTPCGFLRVAACNLACVWCDTYYTWDWSRVNKDDEAHKMDYQDVADAIRKILPPGDWPLLVISGGEPLLQQPALVEVLKLLPEVRTEVETAGTLRPTNAFLNAIDAINCSPKLKHSGNAENKRYKPDVLEFLQDTGKVQAWKFVAQQPSDLDEVDRLVRTHSLAPVFIMPEGIDRETLDRHARALEQAVIAKGWRLTPRLHIQMFGNERGH